MLVDQFKRELEIFSTSPMPIRGLRTGKALPWMLQGTIEENKRKTQEDPNSDWIGDDSAFFEITCLR